MSSAAAFPLEAQASALVSFLARANVVLDPAQAEHLCATLSSTQEPPARHLKHALKGLGITLKHTACLDALAVMKGYASHVAKPRPQYVIAHYLYASPSVSANVRQFPRFNDAMDVLSKRLWDTYASDVPYARIDRQVDYVEAVFYGEPLSDLRVLLAYRDEHGAPAPLPEADVVAFVERIRRLAEVQLKGWVDGALRTANPGYAPELTLALASEAHDGLESDILGWCENREGVALDAKQFTEQVLPALALVGAPGLPPQPLPASEGSWLWSRYDAFVRTRPQPLSAFVMQRKKEALEHNFAPVPIHLRALQEALAAKNVSEDDAAKYAGLDVESWREALEKEALPVRSIILLSGALELASANEIYWNTRKVPWTNIEDGDEVQQWTKRFDHLRMDLFGIAEGNPVAEGFLRRLKRLAQTKPLPRSGCEQLLGDMLNAGYQLCITLKKEFVQDLPIPRERLTTIALLGIWDTRDLEQMVPVRPGADASEDEEEEPSWSEVDEDYLMRFNAIKVTADDLWKLQDEAERMLAKGAEPGFVSAVYSAAEAFSDRKQGNWKDWSIFTNAAIARMTALSRLLEANALAMWSETSTTQGAHFVPSHVMEATARCPLIRVGNEAGFDVDTFNRIVLSHVD